MEIVDRLAVQEVAVVFGILTAAATTVAQVSTGTVEVSSWLVPEAVSAQAAIDAVVAACAPVRYDNDEGQLVEWRITFVSEPYEVVQQFEVWPTEPIEIYSKLLDQQQWILLQTIFDWRLL